MLLRRKLALVPYYLADYLYLLTRITGADSLKSGKAFDR
jgi:hypothetical protein